MRFYEKDETLVGWADFSIDDKLNSRIVPTLEQLGFRESKRTIDKEHDAIITLRYSTIYASCSEQGLKAIQEIATAGELFLLLDLENCKYLELKHGDSVVYIKDLQGYAHSLLMECSVRVLTEQEFECKTKGLQQKKLIVKDNYGSELVSDVLFSDCVFASDSKFFDILNSDSSTDYYSLEDLEYELFKSTVYD